MQTEMHNLFAFKALFQVRSVCKGINKHADIVSKLNINFVIFRSLRNLTLAWKWCFQWLSSYFNFLLNLRLLGLPLRQFQLNNKIFMKELGTSLAKSWKAARPFQQRIYLTKLYKNGLHIKAHNKNATHLFSLKKCT